ncbi:hypothetical protein ACFXJ8_04690 [Nonomuraea sp. NPDC059194]|uniref:hypothetical protein n=1 Tax=Nonomuraea sp. NPDC059194 TaxID=3346764 RepID=UPI00369C4B3E
MSHLRRYTAVSAVGVALLGVLGAAPATGARAQPTTWRLAEIRFHPTDPDAVFESVRAPSVRGGEIRIRVPGERYQLCPGGKETLRFRWNFTRSVRQLRSGDTITASMQFRTESVADPCAGELGGRSAGQVVGADGMGNPFDAQESREMDGGFTGSVGEGPLRAVPFVRPVPTSLCCKTGRVRVAASSYVPTRPKTWFALLIETPGYSNLVIYVYEVVSGPYRP